MIARYRVLADRIGHELTLLSEVVQRCESAVARARQNPVDEDFYVAAAALNLHDFYNGLACAFVTWCVVFTLSIWTQNG